MLLLVVGGEKVGVLVVVVIDGEGVVVVVVGVMLHFCFVVVFCCLLPWCSIQCA